MSVPRSSAAAIGAYVSLYVLGGTDGKQVHRKLLSRYSKFTYRHLCCQVLDSVDIFEPETGTWGAAPNMPTPRADHCVARHRDEVYVVGGTIGNYLKF